MSEDREYLLARLKERETFILEKVSRVQAQLSEVASKQTALSDDLRRDIASISEGVSQVAAGISELSLNMMKHIQRESCADRDRDAILSELSQRVSEDVRPAVRQAGGRSGMVSGGIASFIVAIILGIIERLCSK